MIEFVQGRLIEITPTYAIVNVNGIGYFVNISIHTFTMLKDCDEQIKLLVHLVVREDGFTMYGFYDEFERKLFRYLISVSGVGASTAQVILSSMSPNETLEAILSENVSALQSVKGIGGKTAQRVIVDLKDKLMKEDFSANISISTHNRNTEEALSGLVMLGFSKPMALKAINKIVKEGEETLSVEELIKKALQIL